MAHLTICVPEDHAGELRGELQRMFQECAATVRRANIATERGLDAAEGALVELRDLREAIGQLRNAGEGPVTVSAHPEVLRDALSRQLSRAVAALSVAFDRDEDMGERAGPVAALLGLLATVEAGGSSQWARLAALLDVTVVELRYLLLVAAAGRLRPVAAGAQLDLAPGGALAIAQRLAADGLLRRVPDPPEPRDALLVLSPGAERELGVALSMLRQAP
jgi:DNA-binding MarR family transcriptional regulator